MICPKCRGNGFIKTVVDAGRTIEEDCTFCNNQGEVEINEESLRYLKEADLCGK